MELIQESAGAGPHGLHHAEKTVPQDGGSLLPETAQIPTSATPTSGFLRIKNTNELTGS